MSASSIFGISTNLHINSNQSLLKKKRISKINKNLLNFAKEELTSFNSLKVKIYKNEIEGQKNKNEIKNQEAFFYENDQKNNGVINQIESSVVNSSNSHYSIHVEQVANSDLVDSE